MHSIRLALADDAEGLLEIYKPIVTGTFISFELTPPDPDEFRRRIESHTGVLPWLVLQENNQILGYAYSDNHRSRWGYQWSVEVSAYVAESYQGKRIGQALYTSLLNILRLQGYYNAYAGIALPNPASIAFHEAMGFHSVALYPAIGYKLGQWHDVGWWFLELSVRGTAAPMAPSSLAAIAATDAYKKALESGLSVPRK